MESAALEYELLKLIYEKDRMQLLANTIEQYTGYPIYFTSVNWELFAKSKSVTPGEIISKEALFSSKKTQPHSWSDYVKHKSRIARLVSKSPYLTSFRGKNYLFANAYLDSNLIGTVVLPEHRLPVSELPPDTLEIILKTFSVFHAAALGYREHVRYENWEGILYRLLSGEISSRKELIQKIKENGAMTEPNRFRISVFRARGTSLILLPAYKKLTNLFRSLQVFRCWIEYENAVVLLLNDETPLTEQQPVGFAGLSTSFLRENQIHAGCSDPSGDLMDVPLLYREAVTALDYTNRWDTDNYICSYESCLAYDLLRNTASPTGSLKHYVSGSIEAMELWDREHGTQYVTILRELVYNRFNLTAASAALYMHKSTLSYHMNKMREHFHIDFEDRLQILQLYLSFFIMDAFLHE